MTYLTGSFIFWILACLFYAVQSVLKFRFSVSIFSTWGDRFTKWADPVFSSQRKYRYPNSAPKNWYYRFFRLKYKERFPGSATIFAPFTDAFHMAQMLTNIALVGAVLTFNYQISSSGEFICIAILYKVVWSALHEFCFVYLFIKKESRG